MIDIKITDLESTTELDGLYTVGTDKNNLSKKVSFDFLKDAAAYANRQGDYAKEVGDTIVGNVGVAEYPQFSENVTYRLGEVVIYNGVMYRFIANHAASEWNGADVVRTSIKAENEYTIANTYVVLSEKEYEALREKEDKLYFTYEEE